MQRSVMSPLHRAADAGCIIRNFIISIDFIDFGRRSQTRTTDYGILDAW